MSNLKQKTSFENLVKKMEELTEKEQGKLKGGFASAFVIDTKMSATLGNNCNCKNKKSDCNAQNVLDTL